jgi:hypothetical protein
MVGGTPRISQSFRKGKNGATNATKPKDTKITKAQNMEHTIGKNIDEFHMNQGLRAVQFYKF